MSKQFYFEQFFWVGVQILNVKTVPFQTIHSSINTQFKWKIKTANLNYGLVLFNPLTGPLSSATTPGQSGPGSDGNKEALPKAPGLLETHHQTA